MSNHFSISGVRNHEYFEPPIDARLHQIVPIGMKNRNGSTALMLAALNGHTDSVRVLLRRPTDIDSKDRTGLTALTYAASRDHYDIVEVLLANGADVSSAGSASLSEPVLSNAEK